MRVSQYFNLGRTQPSIDFVDVDIDKDVRVYLDPNAIRNIRTRWGRMCVHYLQHYFQQVIDAINKGDLNKARRLLAPLHEPNETHLGQSRESSRGHAMSGGLSEDVLVALMESKAVKSGLLINLEDSALMVEGIASDIISDITTNVLRGPLIEYTKNVSRQYGIPLTEGVESGPIWDPQRNQWVEEFVELPITNNQKLLLVPKSIIRKKVDFDAGSYYQHFLLTDLQEKELAANTSLVKLLKNKKRVVYKKDLKAQYGSGKEVIVNLTNQDPRVLEKFRNERINNPTEALDHEDFAEALGTPDVDFDSLLDKVFTVPPGNASANIYHESIESLLTAMFYPGLSFPEKESKIHQGRKRIDIAYVNQAKTGFFSWLAQHYPAPNIYIECKNYSYDPENPELDQLSGRFSPSRGQVGFLVCRKLENKELFLQRCRDTALDHRGFVIPLDDDDLVTLVAARVNPDKEVLFRFLRGIFGKLV